jgi:signal transduction histidine kinase/ligand-binding sensor domain-containing protein/DNA-binding response OmpR family regulator
MSYRKIYLTLCCCILWLPGYAQQEQIQFSGLDLSDGLSHNQVNTIIKDARGFMWFGTLSGLNRYDGYQFKVFKHDPADSTSLTDDFITNIYELPDNRLYLDTRGGPGIYNPRSETFTRNVKDYFGQLHIKASGLRDVIRDLRGNFWFNGANDGVFRYNPASGETLQIKCGGKADQTLLKGGIAALQRDRKGNIWVIHEDKTVEMIDPALGKVKRRITLFQQDAAHSSADYRLFVDNAGALWIYRLNAMEGIEYFDPDTGVRQIIDKGRGKLNNNLVNSILQDGKGMIWIGTDHGGINLLDKRDFSIRYLVHKEDDPTSVGQNSILNMYRDDTGIMWVGTFKKGLSFYHEKILKFPLYRHQGTNAEGLAYEDVNRFAEDDQGNLWIGTNGGGLFYFNRKTGFFKRYVHQQDNPNSLANDIIVSLFIDRSKKLWIGTYFGGLDSFDGKTFTHYRHQDGNPASLSDDRVWDILEDSRGRLWIATLKGGLDELDRKSGLFRHKRSGQRNSVSSDYISCLIEDRHGNLWIGTSNGIDKMDLDGRVKHYRNQPGEINTLVNNIVYDLMEDSNGFIWVCTRDGISRMDPGSGTFLNFGLKDGLTEKATLKILEDPEKNLWVSTANGLFTILVSKQRNGTFSYAFRRYDEMDGLQGSAFNANAGYKTRAGELLFGGANGFNLFRSDRIRNDQGIPAIVFPELLIANKPVALGKKTTGNVILKESLVLTSKLELRYNQNAFTISFAALNYFNPRKIRYKYKLEGFDQHWQEVENNNRRATYTNIDPGDYTFRVVSTDASGNWVNNERTMEIKIWPPFWRTTLAYILYAGAFCGSLLWIRQRGITRIKKEFLIAQERQQAKRMHDLDVLKIKFLTNVSHEFRTPLSLIITPLDKLIRQAPEQEKQQLQMIQRNGRRLLNLVNQLLDFRKMEVQELKLHPKQGDVIRFIEELSESFTDVAERKNIHFNFSTDRKSLITVFDHDKIERIIFNLLSNAFKFTPQDGKVTIMLHLTAMADGVSKMVLTLSDTGIGIPDDQQDRIFERFFQHDVPDSMVNQGSGIGLSITREFVKLHGGTISVESEVDEGTTFEVTLYFEEQAIVSGTLTETHIQELLAAPRQSHPEETHPLKPAKNKKPVLMLIEDNDDFRFYLKDNLKAYYQIAEAANGREGWQKILSLHPDLVVSDVSMPEMNGIDLCKKIKNDKRTVHIPVILLTALTSEEQQLSGLGTGASDYMTKPFNFEILLSKIRNLLQQQENARNTYKKQLEFKPAAQEIESVDDKFIRQLAQHIEQHLSDSAYTVDQLSADMNMSRVGLYKKILPLTGKSPVEYIRYYRLHKSKPILLKSQLTIAEVAYEVGFSNPKQFSKYFKEEFGTLPSVFALSKADENQ